MNPYGETRSLTGACVSTTWREVGRDPRYRSSTLLTSQVEWENGLREKNKHSSRQSSSSTTQSFSPPSKLIVPSKLSTLSTPRFSHAATTPLPIHSTWLLLQSSHKKWQLRCPIFSTLPPRSLPGHRWPLPPTKADSPGFCVGQCPGFPSLSQTIHFVALLLIHLPFHSCSR